MDRLKEKSLEIVILTAGTLLAVITKDMSPFYWSLVVAIII